MSGNSSDEEVHKSRKDLKVLKTLLNTTENCQKILSKINRICKLEREKCCSKNAWRWLQVSIDYTFLNCACKKTSFKLFLNNIVPSSLSSLFWVQEYILFSQNRSLFGIKNINSWKILKLQKEMLHTKITEKEQNVIFKKFINFNTKN